MRIALLQQKTPQTSADKTILTLSEIIKDHHPDIVVGPEYMFVAPSGESWDWYKKEPKYSQHIFDENEKRSLEIRLRSLTRNNNTLLIPGTIIWAEKRGQRREYRNSCPVFYDGKKIKEISKHGLRLSDLNYSIPKIHQKFGAGLWTGCTVSPVNYIQKNGFALDGKRYLIEICDDHLDAAKTLRGHYADFQIIVSQSIYPHTTTPWSNLFLQSNGVLIECNGYYPTGFIGKGSKNQIRTIYESTQPATDEVHLIEMGS